MAVQQRTREIISNFSLPNGKEETISENREKAKTSELPKQKKKKGDKNI